LEFVSIAGTDGASLTVKAKFAYSYRQRMSLPEWEEPEWLKPTPSASEQPAAAASTESPAPSQTTKIRRALNSLSLIFSSKTSSGNVKADFTWPRTKRNQSPKGK
jgi:hypothetical protein